MASGQPGDAVRQINRLFRDGTSAALTDGQLLERFSTRRPEAAEAAFEALVNRHGPMVLRVARGLLRDPRDVEDAFQATFLVLVKKAHVLGERDLLGPWLYGVAHRVALKARGVAARRNRREGGIIDDPPTGPTEGPWIDLQPVLHEELNRLPEKYRRPVVLCHLQGLTHAEAAQELAWPVGTVSVRLARARKLLKDRLTRRGLTASAEVWPLALMLDRASGVVPESLIRSTAQAAFAASTGQLTAAGTISAGSAALARGTLTMMKASKIMWLIIPLTLALGLAGGVVVNQQIMLRTIQARAEAERAAVEAQKAALAKPPLAPGKRSPFDVGDGPPNPADAHPSGGFDEGPPARAIPPVVVTGNGTFELNPPPGYFDVPAPDGPEVDRPPIITPGQILAVEVLEALPGRPITGERVVRPDGTISLGFYGDLRVAGLNRNQAKVKLLEHLRKYINDEILGLIKTGMSDNTAFAMSPVDSDRVFIDESANYTPEILEKAARPKVRGENFQFKDQVMTGRLDVIEGWMHRVVKEMGEVKAALQSGKPADPKEPGISDAERLKRIDAEQAQGINVGRLTFLEGELYKALKELEQIRADSQPAPPPASEPAKPAAIPGGTKPG